MNSLSELQGELHKLSAALDALSRQVEDLKPREADETQDFSALEALARQNPIKNPTLAKAGEFERDLYLRMVSTAAFLEDTGRLEKLLYLCRLSVGSGCGQGAMELQKMAYDTERLDWQSAAGELKGMALPLLLDMMMLGNMAGPADERTLDFIASVAELMDVSEEDVTVAARLAAVLLAQDKQKFEKINAQRTYPELSWMVPEEWLIARRSFQNSYKLRRECTHKARFKTAPSRMMLLSSFNFDKPVIVTAKELVPSGTFVKRETPLVDFKRKFAQKEDQKEYDFVSSGLPPIKALRHGNVFIINGPKDERFIYIASPFDSEKAISAWHKTQKDT